mmetsp:Transcript_5328/g.9528  ORF Transcript_5328/g.9528 Transcript_5328/m.9528 type:complete len:106 (+) Transcript_5328:2-319(+)
MNEAWPAAVASLQPKDRERMSDDDLTLMLKMQWEKLSGAAKLAYQQRVPAGTVLDLPGKPMEVPKNDTLPDDEVVSLDSNSEVGGKLCSDEEMEDRDQEDAEEPR